MRKGARCTAGGNVNWLNYYGMSMEVPKRAHCDPAMLFLSIHLKESKSAYYQRHLHVCVYYTNIHSLEDMRRENSLATHIVTQTDCEYSYLIDMWWSHCIA